MNWRQYVRAQLPPLDVSAERENEIIEELAIQLETTYERARAGGGDHEAALAHVHDEVPDWQALALTLGGIERRAHRAEPAPIASHGVRGWLASIAGDWRYAVRAVAAWQAFPAAALLLGLSIAAALTVWAAMDSWQRPLPFAQPDRLALVWGTNHVIGQSRDVVSGPTFRDWQRRSLAFDGLSAFAQGELTITRDGHAGVISSLTVTPDFFAVVRTRLLLGRALELADVGAPRVVISRQFWHSQFAADPAIIGRTLADIGLPHEVVGVLSEDFALLSTPDVVTLLDPRQIEQEARTHYYYWVVARLRETSSVREAQGDLNVVMQDLAAQHPVMRGWTATVEPLAATLAEPVRPSLTILLAIASLVLLVGVGNCANLVASRAVMRQRENAIRTALGATAGRVRRQWVFEGMLLSAVSTALGVGCALVLVEVVSAVAPRSAAIAGSAATVDLPAIHLGLASAPMVIGLMFVIGGILGAVPLRGIRFADIRSASGGAAVMLTRGRRWLLVGQSAIATVLTAIAGLLLAVVLQLIATSPGFDPSRVTAFVFGGVHDLDPPARSRYYARVLEAARATPGVLSAGINDYVPLTNEDDYEGLELPGRRRDGNATPREEWRRISAGYFDTLGIPIVRGRAFADADDDRAPSVVIVNQAMADKYWPGADPIGTRMRITNKAYGWSEVVGIAGDVREAGLDRPAKPMMFVPYHRDPRPVMGLFVATTGEGEATAAGIRRAIWSVDASRPIFGSQSMSRIVSDSYAIQRSVLNVAAALAALALLLIAGGTYAIVTLVTLGRRHEMAVRMALGAGPLDVAAAVLTKPCALAGGGIAAGLAVAWFAVAIIQAQLATLPGLDLEIAAASTIVVMAVIAGACATPLVSALRTDPAVSLKGE